MATMSEVPVSFSVQGYERPPTPPTTAGENDSDNDVFRGRHCVYLIYQLPIIHIAGQAIDPDTENDFHWKIKGTVRMIGGDAVRWSLVCLGLDQVF
jgi:hypothetical protein